MNDDSKQFRNWDCVKAYSAWRKALMRDRNLGGLAACAVAKPYGVDIRLVALCIAEYGVNGFNCYPDVATVAELIGCHPNTLKKYRKQLIELGWFTEVTRSGGANHRSLVIRINIPEAK